MTSYPCAHSPVFRLRFGVLAVACCLGLPLPAAAASLLRCEVSLSGETRHLVFSPVADPYAVQAVDIDGRFRFKAVVVGDERQVDYVKLYTYDQEGPQAVLLHQATYASPFVAAGLTGRNFVYSPRLGRELQYTCTLAEAGQ